MKKIKKYVSYVLSVILVVLSLYFYLLAMSTNDLFLLLKELDKTKGHPFGCPFVIESILNLYDWVSNFNYEL